MSDWQKKLIKKKNYDMKETKCLKYKYTQI